MEYKLIAGIGSAIPRLEKSAVQLQRNCLTLPASHDAEASGTDGREIFKLAEPRSLRRKLRCAPIQSSESAGEIERFTQGTLSGFPTKNSISTHAWVQQPNHSNNGTNSQSQMWSMFALTFRKWECSRPGSSPWFRKCPQSTRYEFVAPFEVAQVGTL
jgi:hypothetical protein